MTIQTISRAAAAAILTIAIAFTSVAPATAGKATWSKQYNVSAGEFQNFSHNKCFFSGHSNSVTAHTNWRTGSRGNCDALRVRYKFNVNSAPVSNQWTSWKTTAYATQPQVSLEKANNVTMTAHGHAGFAN